MTALLHLLTRALSGGSALALPVALAGGFIAALNPCCLAMYPAAAATCCGIREADANCKEGQERGERRSLPNSAAFVVGMALAMSMLGIAAALAGRVASTGHVVRYAIAVIPLVMGLQVLGWVHLPLPRFSAKRSRLDATGAFGAGFLLSLVIAPCGTPILAAVLSYAALKGNTPFGGLLLFIYGLGAGIPVLLAASASARFARWLDVRGYRRWVDWATGGLLLGIGFYLLWIA